MTNKDKFLRDGVSVEEFVNEFHNFCAKQSNNNASSIRLEQFLSRKAQPTLTEDERVILRNMEFKDYNIIGRKESGDLYVNYQENDSFNGTWLIMFKKHLFQFIKNGEEYEIKELLGDEK